MSGDHIGTPAYMAPEQVEPDGREPGPACDVYALGVTLFEALTLQSPYPSHSRESLFQCIVRGDRRRLRQVRRGLPADLELVLDKALDPDPARRYAGMIEFAEDLRRVQKHEPPAARRIGPALRLRRWCQRNPVAATFLTLLSLGLGTAMVLAMRLEAESQHRLAMAYGNLAGQLVDENPEHALEMAKRGLELAPGDPESLGLLLRALQEVQPHDKWPLPWPEDAKVTPTQLTVAPQGDAALILGVQPGAGGSQSCAPPVLWCNGTMSILDIEGGTYDAHWSPDGEQFVTTGPDSPPQLWDKAGGLVDTFVVPDAPPGLKIPRARFLPDGVHIVFACSDGVARILDRSKGNWTGLEPSIGQVLGLGVSGDGQYIAIGEVGGRRGIGRIVLHKVEEALRGVDGEMIHVPDRAADPHPISALELSQHGDLLQAYSLREHQCSLWRRDGTPLRSWGSRPSPGYLTPFDPRQDQVLQLSQDHVPQFWQSTPDAFEPGVALAGHAGMVRIGRFRRDGQRLLTAGVDGTARIWRTEDGRQLLVLRGFADELILGDFLASGSQCLLVTRNFVHRFGLGDPLGSRLEVGDHADFHAIFPGPGWPGSILTADTSQHIRVSDDAGQPTRPDVKEDTFRRAALQLAPSRRWLISTSRYRGGKTQAVIYDRELAEVQTIELSMAEPKPVFGPDDQLLLLDIGKYGEGSCRHLVRGADGQWHDSAEDVVASFRSASEGATALAFHAPTATLALAKDGAAAHLFHWRTVPPGLEPGQLLLRGAQRGHRLTFAPNGRQLLLVGADKVVRLVEFSDPNEPDGRVPSGGRVRTELKGHIGLVVGLGFSPSGDKLLVAATESGVTIHDLDGELLLPIRPRDGAVSMARFLPDADPSLGTRILLGTTARRTRVLPIEPAKLIEIANGMDRPAMSDAYLQNYEARVQGSRRK